MGNVIGSVSEPTVEALGNFCKKYSGYCDRYYHGDCLFTYFYVADKDYITRYSGKNTAGVQYYSALT